jgi:hypothetical protein
MCKKFYFFNFKREQKYHFSPGFLFQEKKKKKMMIFSAFLALAAPIAHCAVLRPIVVPGVGMDLVADAPAGSDPSAAVAAAHLGAAPLTCQDVPAGKAGSLCRPPKRACARVGSPPDFSFSNSAARFNMLASSLQNQCASFKQYPAFATGACQQSCPLQSAICYKQIMKFSW